MRWSRRDFLQRSGMTAAAMAGTLGAPMGILHRNVSVAAKGETAPGRAGVDIGYERIDSAQRQYHVSTGVDNFRFHADLPEIFADAGVTDAWMTTFLYGFWPYPWDEIDHWVRRLMDVGVRVHFISVPFCHGGGSLDPPDPSGFPNLPPKHWKTMKRIDGSENWGWGFHESAMEELCGSVRTMYERYGKCDFFLDDDFRFSSSPGSMCGCICDEHRAKFLADTGTSESKWEQVLDEMRSGTDTELARRWIDWTCDQLTSCFHRMQAAAPQVDLGNMVMFMGSEKSGIRLDDYRDALFRVGELMFSDGEFGSIQGRTAELFSALFHMRFPSSHGRAFSETTIYPPGSLSAANMAAKLTVSTIADTRNTCFMSGLTPIPPEYWTVLKPRMRHESQIHAKVAGHRAAGPLKHYWGDAARYFDLGWVGELFCQFLAIGVPFEVCDLPAADGWTFLGRCDSRAFADGSAKAPQTKFCVRSDDLSETDVANAPAAMTRLDGTLESLFAWRREVVIPTLEGTQTPYVEEEVPIVCAWYPTAKAVVLWNLGDETQTLTLRIGDQRRRVTMAGLESRLVEL